MRFQVSTRVEAAPDPTGMARPQAERPRLIGLPPSTPATRKSSFINRKSALRNPHSGVALVITLILLSVITFMAVTFLVVSTSERKSVTMRTEQTQADLAANIGFEYGLASTMSRILATTNMFNYGLLVSTNYIRSAGLDTRPLALANPTNVNFDYTTTGAPLTLAQQQQNIANLLYSSRVPVIITNPITRSNEFRFYYDANRNGLFEFTGAVIETNGGVRVTNSYIGDPQWIGVLERPGLPHSSSNLFLQRFAFMVVPAGQALDLNHIHNDASYRSVGAMAQGRDGFRRDQGFATYEINLAAFLADLNTNIWWQSSLSPGNAQYQYLNWQLPSLANTGWAFDDASSILAYRYNSRPDYLQPPGLAINPAASRLFATDFIDELLAGPIMTGIWWPRDTDSGAQIPLRYFWWNGADGTNHNQFVSLQELYDPAKTGPSFAARLLSASDPALLGTNDYNRYTFYRLAAQMGVDSASEQPGRMNLNYDNLVQANANGVASSTNLFPWRPADFFVNAANRLLTNAGFAFPSLTAVANVGSLPPNLTNGIQIWPTNLYTPSVHRYLQLAANIYDATTNNGSVLAGTNNLGLPSVFRPIFHKTTIGTNTFVYIVGYHEETDASLASSSSAPPTRELRVPTDLTLLQPADMVYGVPVIVGAKKGWPNFNQFAMDTQIQLTRKLQFGRSKGPDSDVDSTNQMYLLGVSNVLGVEGWNSYVATVQRNLQLITVVDQIGSVSNEAGALVMGPDGQPLNRNYQHVASSNILTATWPGLNPKLTSDPSFKVPIFTNYWFLTNSEYQFRSTADPPDPAQGRFVPISGIFESNFPSVFPLPHWWVTLQTRLRFILVDTDANRIVDYVNLDSVEDPIDVISMATSGGSCGSFYSPDAQTGSEWCTNRMKPSLGSRSHTYGMENQIEVCMGLITPQNWNNFVIQSPVGTDIPRSIQYFNFQFGLGVSDGSYGKSNAFDAPFNPFRNIFLHTGWSANDPLVHYTVGDLTDGTLTNRIEFDDPTPKQSSVNNLGKMNGRYEPWDGGGNPASSSSKTKTDITLKDPQVTGSDAWDFPSGKLPNPGWMGRIHRGTPWETIYLKSLINTNFAIWAKWVGGVQSITNLGQISTNIIPVWPGNTNPASFMLPEAFFTRPILDRDVVDLFTTSLNDNMARGRLSINQTNLAAWSAVLSGVSVLTNLTATTYTNLFISPAGAYDPLSPPLPPLARIVTGINNSRTNFPGGTFQRLGDILSVPELSTNSPYLATNNQPVDAVVERIPQQILGLLQCDSSPKFVIYAYGQALKPAERSLLTTQPFFGMCTNYQVMAETATRTVVRIEGTSSNPRAVIESFNVLPPD